MINDLLLLWFSPKVFFASRFSLLDRQKIRILGFLGVSLGLILGSLFTYFLSSYVVTELSLRPGEYALALKNLGLDSASFQEMLGQQKAYALILALLSPIIAYMAPHIFGGALYAFLWLLVRENNKNLEFDTVLDCTSIALSSMIFYALPAIGPFLALIMVGLNLSRALFVRESLVGFMKVMSIIMAMYMCFFISAASLQLLAVPVAAWLKF